MTTVHEQLRMLEELAKSPHTSEGDLRRRVLELVETLRLLHDEMQQEAAKVLEENESLREENHTLRETAATLEKQREGLLEQTRRVHPGHDYQRQIWFFGWLEKDPKRIKTKTKDGEIREKTYNYWYFHWLESGKHRSRYIGKDECWLVGIDRTATSFSTYDANARRCSGSWRMEFIRRVNHSVEAFSEICMLAWG